MPLVFGLLGPRWVYIGVLNDEAPDMVVWFFRAWDYRLVLEEAREKYVREGTEGI